MITVDPKPPPSHPVPLPLAIACSCVVPPRTTAKEDEKKKEPRERPNRATGRTSGVATERRHPMQLLERYSPKMLRRSSTVRGPGRAFVKRSAS